MDELIRCRTVAEFIQSHRSPMLFYRRSSCQHLLHALGVLALVIGIWLGLPAAAWAAPSASSPEVAVGPEQVSIQPYLERTRDRVTRHELANGIKFLILQRDVAPVVSFVTYADVGSVDEPVGQTGVAHFLEHLAFKGTQRIGTRDYAQEQGYFERLDAVFARLKDTTDAEEQATLAAEFARLQAEAASFVEQNKYGQIVETAGGTGLNATTSADSTEYFYSFPANKLELWMSLESERFLEPVFREFYKEKQVILEERRLRTDNSPIGAMVEKFLETAFTASPYGRPIIGYVEDLENIERQDVMRFFDRYYAPSNLTMAVVGDVDPQDVIRLAELYFGRYPARPAAPPAQADEPPQEAPREFTLALPTEPWYLEGYHRPSGTHPDSVIYDLIERILSDGRTSRLYRQLVETQQVALSAQGASSFPGDKYDNMMLFFALSAPDRSLDEVAAALQAELERLKTEPVSAEELDRVKTQARSQRLRSLKSNQGMANLLAEYEVKTGDWQNLFFELDEIAAVAPADIQRVARETFEPNNRTVGRLVSAGE